MNRWLSLITVAIVGVGLVVIVVLLLNPDKAPIPGKIKAELGSTLLVPEGSAYTGSHATAKFDTSRKLLSYRINIAGAPSVTVSEQPAPTQFTDINGYYQQFVNDLGEYDSFGSIDGTVYLIHPKNNPKGTAAVLTDAGTLMFVNPDSNLTGAQWRAFFAALQVVH